jgi:HlyD family secretion protein
MQKKEKKESGSATLFVFENGVPKPVKVSVGISDNRFTEVITEELKAGDRIIVEENKDANSAKDSKNSPPPMRPF